MTKKVDTRDLPDDTVLPGHQYSLGEMRGIIRAMREINSKFYDMCFYGGIGGTCHAFIEFTGLQAKFIDMCQEALNKGIEFPFANTHTQTDLGIQLHDVAYLAEKFDCIFGPSLASDKKLRDAFVSQALPEVEHGARSGPGGPAGSGEAACAGDHGPRRRRPSVRRRAG